MECLACGDRYGTNAVKVANLAERFPLHCMESCPSDPNTGRARWLRWTERLLVILIVLVIGVTAALWIGIFTSRCEGFGCIGLGVIAAAALGLEVLAMAATGLLIWLHRRQGCSPVGWALLLGIGAHVGYYLVRGSLR